MTDKEESRLTPRFLSAVMLLIELEKALEAAGFKTVLRQWL